ncbi:MAG: hypothetical protein ACM3UZ_02240 [Acidobacteriota bacterium]
MSKTKWEYQVLVNDVHITMDNREELMLYLNAMGADGWELMNVSVREEETMTTRIPIVSYIFKRPIE